jgi:hypothetical protein
MLSEVLEHSPHSLDLAPCNYPFNGHLIQHPSGRHFDTNAYIQCEVCWWMLGFSPDLYHKGMDNHVAKWGQVPL